MIDIGVMLWEHCLLADGDQSSAIHLHPYIPLYVGSNLLPSRSCGMHPASAAPRQCRGNYIIEVTE